MWAQKRQIVIKFLRKIAMTQVRQKTTMEKMLSYCTEEDRQAIQEGRAESLSDALEGFEALDLDDDGYVEKQDLVEMTKQGMQLTDEDVDEFFRTFDIARDGRVSKAEWEEVFGNMYDHHIAKGLEETFAEAFPGEAN